MPCPYPPALMTEGPMMEDEVDSDVLDDAAEVPEPPPAALKVQVDPQIAAEAEAAKERANVAFKGVCAPAHGGVLLCAVQLAQ